MGKDIELPRRSSDSYTTNEPVAHIVIVSGNELFREGLASLLKAELGCEIVGVGETLKAALAGGSASLASVVLLETATLTQEDRALLPGILALGTVKIVAVESEPSNEFGPHSLSPKSSKATLLKTVKEVAGTRKGIVREGRSTYGSRLTARELDVAKLVAKGHPNRRISQMLELQEQSVKNLVSVILRKLQCENRVQVALRLSGLQQEEAAQ